MRHRFGEPDIRVRGKPAPRQPFVGHKGLIVFDIVFGANPNGGRALGHADLWDGETFFDEISGVSRPSRDFFNIADRVSLWLAAGATKLPR